MTIGAHINDNNIDNSDLINNSNIIQVFVPYRNKKNNSYKGEYVVHASYTINIAKKWDEYSSWIIQFIHEIEMAHKLNAIGIVIHMGKQLDLSTTDAYNNMYTSLIYVHNYTKDKYSSVKIFLETSTGQGSELCYKLEDYAYFFKKFIRHHNKELSERFRLCLDTCHIFAAGYDITTESRVLLYLEALEELIGTRYVGLIHLNDSKNDQGSHIDRHENISNNKGYIGKDGLIAFAKYFKKLNVPIILETPNNDNNNDILKDLLLIKNH